MNHVPALVCSFLVLAAVAVGALTVPAAAQASSSATAGEGAERGNAQCPVTPDETADPEIWTDFDGTRVFFCCQRCKSRFEADPAKYATTLASLGSPSSPHGSSDPEGHGSHDHAHDHGQESSFSLVAYVGRLHVVVIHFPIALLVVAALFELVGWAGRGTHIDILVRASVGLGALSAVAAVALGFANALTADYGGTLATVFWWHRAAGIAVAVSSVATWLVVCRSAPGASRTVARACVFFTALLVGITGHLGGSLVFGWSYFMP